jgi:electron transport complex protein RnfC
MPLVSKLITVDGGAVANPSNVVVPIGTPVSDVFEFCGGFKLSPRKLIYGGPMMGTAILDAAMPVIKQNNAILAFTKKEADKMKEKPCIRCGRCAAICPMNLQPLETEPAFRVGDLERVKAVNTHYCIECGCCSYICPSKRHLTQTMRLAKAALKEGK